MSRHARVLIAYYLYPLPTYYFRLTTCDVLTTCWSSDLPYCYLPYLPYFYLPYFYLPYCEQMAPVLAEAVIELTAAGGVAYLVSCATRAPWRDTCTLARHMHASLLASSVAAAG